MAGTRRGANLDELRAIYEGRLPELTRVAAAIVGDREAARDVVQEAFVRAVKSRRSFDGSGELGGWVWRIVVNAARDERSRRRDVLAEVPEPEPCDDDGRRGHVREAVEQLPERQRLVLFLRYYADLDYRQIAQAVSIGEGTVGATLHAAHERLRGLLSEVTR
ncbi:MAG TPA: sigma-70 family RNA polymerase sigma factor [Gaiellaceae bacterium]|nr:sigma-70 family RNA polymerase sigma factor [Gaiellaceae bacterium]